MVDPTGSDSRPLHQQQPIGSKHNLGMPAEGSMAARGGGNQPQHQQGHPGVGVSSVLGSTGSVEQQPQQQQAASNSQPVGSAAPKPRNVWAERGAADIIKAATAATTAANVSNGRCSGPSTPVKPQPNPHRSPPKVQQVRQFFPGSLE